ncbi:MAG TPA: type 1 glutamine amidotransferase domain-containing protein [Bryobacteraceae bacterium]|nr:type 1 glutamine amidotransferase domain-containing protein [Bryobacteraceae bacterium]
MQNKLAGKRIAILVADGFEQVEMTEPRKALENAGARTDLISPAKPKVQAAKHHDKGDTFPVDVPLDLAQPGDYDALLLPGGVANPDQLRTIPKAVHFVRSFFDRHKPVAAICHAPWMLVEANVVQGRNVTSWPSLQTDLRNAGAKWTDQPAVIDNGLVTSRKPDDIPAFNDAMIEVFSKAPEREVEPAGISRGRY